MWTGPSKKDIRGVAGRIRKNQERNYFMGWRDSDPVEFIGFSIRTFATYKCRCLYISRKESGYPVLVLYCSGKGVSRHKSHSIAAVEEYLEFLVSMEKEAKYLTSNVGAKECTHLVP